MISKETLIYSLQFIWLTEVYKIHPIDNMEQRDENKLFGNGVWGKEKTNAA